MKKLLACIFIFALLISGCGQDSSQNEPNTAETVSNAVSFTDALGREITVDNPTRVAAMIGSFADMWCLAGGKDSLVAAANDTWTSFDLELDADVVNIGSSKDPNLEILLSSEPDFVIASTNTSADIELLEAFEQVGITTAYFDVESFDDYLHMLDICTQITGCTDNYVTYGTELEKTVNEARSRQDGSSPKVLYVRATGTSCKAKGSSGNLLGEMLAELGCVNIADGDRSILENLSMEAIIADEPDYIFAVMNSTDVAKAQASLEQTLLSNPAWDSLKAVREGRFYTMDNSLYNLKPNARWGEAYEKLADILYPKE